MGYGVLRPNFIGGDNDLIVSLTSYQPEVQCTESTLRYPQNCDSLLNKIKVSTEVIIFGDTNDPRVDVRTPYTVNERKTPPTLLSTGLISNTDVEPTARCTAKITTVSFYGVATSWYEIYKVLTAVNAMCVRQRKGGFATIFDSSTSSINGEAA